jgi:hypothetical protein
MKRSYISLGENAIFSSLRMIHFIKELHVSV